jgi:cysteine synthase A
MKAYNGITELIGKTPLLKLNNLKKELSLTANLYAKLEYFNPAGSVKDRVALYMIEDAEKRKKITKGATIIEPTSGNTGIGIAMVSASKGYKAVIVMPDSMSVERIKIIRGYGAEVVLTKGALGMKGAIDKANEIQKNTPNSIILGQFSNPVNPLAHYYSTGKEIYADMNGKIDIFVAGIGTGGTISGIGRYLKEQNKNIKVIGVEPESSPLITKGVSGAHKIQGIGANFMPSILNLSVIDNLMVVSDEGAINASRLIAKKEGVLVGISSGASLSVAIQLAKLKENDGKNIVCLLPDTGERYLSTELFE